MDAQTVAPRPATRRGFTLVEMLTVVVIIGILASIVTGVAWRVRVRAGVTAIRLEITNIEGALDIFKSKYHAYPPDFTDDAAVTRFIATAWPHYPNPENWKNVIPAEVRNPAAALVFWLGGPIGTDGMPMGFSPNPRNPFETTTTGGRVGPFFDFNPDRIRDLNYGNATPTTRLYYFQPNASSGTEPYVYFRARADKTYTTGAAWGNCKPCYDCRINPTSPPFAKNTSFQIRAPGRDGKHGADTNFAVDSYGDEKTYDDIANFSDGTFGDARP